ncbi:MAG: lipid-A-disaccharide synthase, partial [Acidobacteria bacterium]
MNAAADELLVVAGEASGDLHGARLLAALRRRRPGLEAYGLGGDELRGAGLRTLADSAEISVVGISEALRVLRRARQIFAALLAEVDRRGTRHAVLIDFPEFNLRLARQLKRRGVRVIYYISPQVWAWRRRRVRTIARDVDRMLVLFPFEESFYRQHGVEVIHVGHPLVDEVPSLPHAWDSLPAGVLPRRPLLSLLPGSRPSEVAALLPVQLAAAARLAEEMPLAVQLIEAPAVPAALFDRLLADSPLPVERRRRDRFDALARSHLAFCASGTATLEVGLIGTPLVVVYRVTAWSYWLGRALVRLPAISLVNLVLGEGAVPELVQDRLTPAALAAEGRRLLSRRPAVDAMRAALARLRP